ncbi:MAG: DNA repair protein RadA, partial [Sphingomonadaceae bacterium]
EDMIFSGEVRRAAHAELRLKEAAKLGFTRALVPVGTRGVGGLEAQPCGTVAALVDRIARR